MARCVLFTVNTECGTILNGFGAGKTGMGRQIAWQEPQGRGLTDNENGTHRIEEIQQLIGDYLTLTI